SKIRSSVLKQSESAQRSHDDARKEQSGNRSFAAQVDHRTRTLMRMQNNRILHSGPMGAPEELLPTILESALRSNRTPAVVLLILVPLVSWIWIATMARDMYGPMSGASAWMMTMRWDVHHLLLLWAMWAVMMTAMMLPSASPMLLLYGTIAKRSAQVSDSRQIYAFAAGYIVVWTAFSLGATVLQRILANVLLLSPMMKITSPKAAGMLLLIAGVYQLTPIKLA